MKLDIYNWHFFEPAYIYDIGEGGKDRVQSEFIGYECSKCDEIVQELPKLSKGCKVEGWGPRKEIKMYVRAE